MASSFIEFSSLVLLVTFSGLARLCIRSIPDDERLPGTFEYGHLNGEVATEPDGGLVAHTQSLPASALRVWFDILPVAV